MPRPKRADEKNAIYHALNRGNGRSVIFQKDGDYEAFENILAEGLEGRFKSFPVQDDKQLDGIRWAIRRGSPFGQSNWVESIARRLDLESTLRPRGRPKKKSIPTDPPNKES